MIAERHKLFFLFLLSSLEMSRALSGMHGFAGVKA